MYTGPRSFSNVTRCLQLFHQFTNYGWVRLSRMDRVGQLGTCKSKCRVLDSPVKGGW